MVTSWNRNLPPENQFPTRFDQMQPYRPTDNPKFYNQPEFVGQLENTNRSFLPDIINSNRAPYTGPPSNDVRPRSISPYQGRTRNPYEFDYPPYDQYQHQPNSRNGASPFSRPNDRQYSQQTYEGPRSRTPFDDRDARRLSGHSMHLPSGDYHTPIRRSADGSGRYSKSPLERRAPTDNGLIPEDPVMKKVYGQYLLDQVTIRLPKSYLLVQMKLNRGKKFYERQKRIEEDRKFLNENNFFDRFGKTRGRFFNRFRMKPKEVQGQSLDSSLFMKSQESNASGASNGLQHSQNYKYNPNSARLGEEKAINNQLAVIPEERQYSAAVSQSRQEDKFDGYFQRMKAENFPQNSGAAQIDETANRLETDIKSQLDFKSQNIYTAEQPKINTDESELLRYNHKNDLEIKAPENPKQISAQQINSIRQRAYERPLNQRRLDDELKNNPAILQFIQKLEYQKSLEYQMLERKLNKSNDKKVRQLEELVEELKESRDQIKKELERKSASPRTNNANVGKPIFNDSSEFTRIPDKQTLKKYHFTPGKKAAPPQEISNNSAPSKKNFATQDTYGNWDPMNMTPDYSGSNIYHYLQLQHEFSKIREELNENTKRLQNQMTDFRSSNKNQYGEKHYRHNGAESKAPEYRFNFQKEILKENPTIITNPLRFNESKMSLLNETQLIPIQKTEQSPNTRGNRGQLDHLLEMANNIEVGLNSQNTQMRKEIQDLKIEIFNLRNKKMEKPDYDDLKFRLTTMADQQFGNGKKFNSDKIRLQKRPRGVKRKQREIDVEPQAKQVHSIAK